MVAGADLGISLSRRRFHSSWQGISLLIHHHGCGLTCCVALGAGAETPPSSQSACVMDLLTA
jgi:hypothetical protein